MSASPPARPMSALAALTLAATAGWWAARSESAAADTALRVTPEAAAPADTNGPVPLVVPDLDDLPEGPLGDAIRRGKALVERTTEEMPPGQVGADLHCASCHLGAGTVAGAGPFVGLAGVFPVYRARTGAVDTLEDRVNDCMERSMNGRPLPHESPEMDALLAYMTWLSRDVPIGRDVAGRGFAKLGSHTPPDPDHGRALYAERCASCHGADGQGQDTPDGGYLYPPLWGDRSFNIAAGMARHETAAAFLKANMPLGQGGSLTDQEAIDLAAFFTAQPRPDFADKAKDWPQGGKPADARY